MKLQVALLSFLCIYSIWTDVQMDLFGRANNTDWCWAEVEFWRRKRECRGSDVSLKVALVTHVRADGRN